MDAPHSTPRPFFPVSDPSIAPKGTLLGMAPLRSLASEPPGAATLPREFDFWNNPPAALGPIVPCDEPDDEDVYQWRPASPALPVAVPPAPSVLRIDDPVILPMRNRDRGERQFWLLMTAAIAIATIGALILRFAL